MILCFQFRSKKEVYEKDAKYSFCSNIQSLLNLQVPKKNQENSWKKAAPVKTRGLIILLKDHSETPQITKKSSTQDLLMEDKVVAVILVGGPTKGMNQNSSKNFIKIKIAHFNFIPS